MTQPWSCLGKVRFESMALAKRVARERHKGSAQRKSGKLGDAYRCDQCAGFHIGRRNGAVRRVQHDG